MFRRVLVALALSASLSASNAAPLGAEEGEARTHPIEEALQRCMDGAGSTADMIACEDEAYKKWDEELNRVYTALVARLTAKQKEALKTAQVAWIAHRDRELQWVAALYDGFDGTMYQPMRVHAAKEVVRRRSQELGHYLELIEEHSGSQDGDGDRSPKVKASGKGKRK